MSHSTFSALVCCCLLVFIGVGEAVKGSKKESIAAMGTQVTGIVEFGFERTGTVSVEVAEYLEHKDDEELGFFLCTQAQQKELLATTDVKGTFCSSRSEKLEHSEKYNDTFAPWTPTKDVCELNMVDPMDDRLDLYSVFATDLYTLSLLSCSECPSSSCSYQRIIVNYELINPGGNHLSTADWALPKMYSYCFLGWVVVMGIFGLAMGANVFEEWYYTHPERGNPDLAWMVESQTRSRAMHMTLLLAAATKGGVVLMDAMLWDMLQSLGYKVSWVVMAKNVLFSLSECVIFAWLLLAGLGWCVVVREVDPDEIQTLSSSLVALSLSLLFFSMYNSSEDMMSLVVMYVFLLPNIFSNIHNNVDGLRFHLTWLRGLLGGAGRGDFNDDDRRALDWMVHSLTAKINFYRSLKALLIGYLLLILAVNVSTIFLPWWGWWLSSLGYECLLLGFVFRIFLIVWPSRWRDGLFWFQGEEEDDDAIHDWTDFGRRLFGLGGGWESAGAGRSSRGEEYIEKLREFDDAVSKKTVLVQFPIPKKEETKEEGGQIITKNDKEEEVEVVEGREEEEVKEMNKEKEKEKEKEEEGKKGECDEAAAAGERKGKGEEEEEVFVGIIPSDELLPSTPSSSSSCSPTTTTSDVVINLSSSSTPTVVSLLPNQETKHSYSHQIEEIEEPETPRNVYFAVPMSATRYLERGGEEREGEGMVEEGGEPRESDAVVLANLLREVGFY